jgi:hypothetical protein
MLNGYFATLKEAIYNSPSVLEDMLRLEDSKQIRTNCATVVLETNTTLNFVQHVVLETDQTNDFGVNKVPEEAKGKFRRSISAHVCCERLKDGSTWP